MEIDYIPFSSFKYVLLFPGLPDDGEFQYFLAVAELQKNIEELKVIKVMSEKNLSFLEQQLQRE